MADNNTGTFPFQSERMYQALKGKRATVRYMQLPVSRTGIARARVWGTHWPRWQRGSTGI